jgi:hypothetical protein
VITILGDHAVDHLIAILTVGRAVTPRQEAAGT